MEGLGALLLPALAILLLGFMFWTQRRRQSAISALQDSLAVGDDVCTTSGLFGRITALDEIMVTLEVAANTQVRFDRRAIATKVDTTGRPITGAGTATGPVDAPGDPTTPTSEK